MDIFGPMTISQPIVRPVYHFWIASILGNFLELLYVTLASALVPTLHTCVTYIGGNIVRSKQIIQAYQQQKGIRRNFILLEKKTQGTFLSLKVES